MTFISLGEACDVKYQLEAKFNAAKPEKMIKYRKKIKALEKISEQLPALSSNKTDLNS